MSTALTRLVLTKKLGQWSGQLLPSKITDTVTPDDDQVADMVEYIDQAWLDIQLSQSNWAWMINRSVDAVALSADNRVLTMATIDATARAVVPFIDRDFSPERYLLLKHPTTATVHRAVFVDYEVFRGYLDRGSRPTQRATRYTIRKNGDLEFDPIPDVAYTLNCDWIHVPVEMATDSATPDMPNHFHRLVVWWALMHNMDVDLSKRYKTAERQYKRMLNRLNIEQLPASSHSDYLSTAEPYSW